MSGTWKRRHERGVPKDRGVRLRVAAARAVARDEQLERHGRDPRDPWACPRPDKRHHLTQAQAAEHLAREWVYYLAPDAWVNDETRVLIGAEVMPDELLPDGVDRHGRPVVDA